MAFAANDRHDKAIRNHQFAFEYTLCDSENLYIWKHVSCHIAKQLQANKGVSIKGFGTFTVSRKNLDTGAGDGRYAQLSCPVFNIHKQFALYHDLQYHNCFVPGTTPVLPVNFSTIACLSRVARDYVENCTKEIVRSVSKAIDCSNNVDLCFMGIGRLTFRKGRVKMKFYREFIDSMDCSGQLLDALHFGPALKDTALLDSPCCDPHSNCGTIVIPNVDVAPNDATEFVILRKQKKLCGNAKCSCESKKEPVSCIKKETEKVRPINKDHRMTSTKFQKDYYTRMTGYNRMKTVPKMGCVANDSVPTALLKVYTKVCAEM